MSELKPCPFCGCEMELVLVGRDWFRIKPVDGHDDFCPFGECHEWDCSQANPEWANEHVQDWNTRASDDTITEQEKVISELLTMLEKFRPYSIYDDEYDEEEFLGGTFEYNDGSEQLGYEVAALLDKHKQSKGE